MFNFSEIEQRFRRENKPARKFPDAVSFRLAGKTARETGVRISYRKI